MNKGRPPFAIMPVEQWRQFYISKFAAQDACPDTTIHNSAVNVHPDSHFGRPITASEVIDAFAKMGTAKAVGADGVPAEFISKACTHHQYCTEYHFAGTLAELFTLVLTQTHMPVAWKSKRICPVHKRGDVHNPSNYRPISVATTFYRAFTCVMA
jgi:hypothetical protein